MGVISDIHFDIRPAFAAEGLSDAVDGYALSFEVGAQKPSAVIYRHALKMLEVTPSQALMVGDRAVPDGGAVEHGLNVLLVPPLEHPGQRRLHRVCELVLGHHR